MLGSRWDPAMTLSGSLLWLFSLALTASAADDESVAPGATRAPGWRDFFAQWFAVSDAAKESQPHWMTPLVTVTPRLEQEFRYDQYWQTRAGGVEFDNYGNGKGFEFIPTPSTEVIIGVPAYEIKQTPKGNTYGWADETLLAKYRFISAKEEQGNYIVTGFLGVSLPSGNLAFTNRKGIVTPTIAAGKGWGTRNAGVDIQSTLGVGIPVADEKAIGTTVTWNTSLQAHVFGKLWPEIEANYTSYHDGAHAGKDQLALTAGVIAGRYALGPRARLILGAGYEWPVSSFSIYDHIRLATARVAF
ncbi:MAG: hypothetical protein WA446_06260 [Steroidobacteraceae bacterium]